jgi:hypothetical protein
MAAALYPDPRAAWEGVVGGSAGGQSGQHGRRLGVRLEPRDPAEMPTPRQELRLVEFHLRVEEPRNGGAVPARERVVNLANDFEGPADTRDA